ncbi:MAG: two-component system cell cycle sensor histidine kinase/response regulator CckA [Desulforhopalus sp.]|jgi:two-component system cell cycle sensor histidine kinase/response regulator CckA
MILCITLFFSILFPTTAYLFANTTTIDSKPVDILLLNSYNQEMNWVKGITKGILDSFQPDQSRYNVHIENMDTKHFFSKQYNEAFNQYLHVKYQDTNISLILASDNNAYDFLREKRDSLFPDVPVIFCGVNDYEPSQLTGLKQFTGVEERITVVETIELIRQFHPDTTEIFIINDFLKTGRAWTTNIQKAVADYPANIKFRYSANLTLLELQSEISQLSPTTVALLGVYFADKNGLSSTYEEMGKSLTKFAKVPVYCLAEFNIHQHVIGGIVISGYLEGVAIANIGKKVLNGTSADSIPVNSTGSNRGVFNHNQLRKYGIEESMLPEGNIIKYRDFSLYSEYKIQIWAVFFMISALLVTIIFLVTNIKIKRRNAIELKESVMWFQQLYQQAPVMLQTIDNEGLITQVNQLWLDTLKYNRDEVIGTSSTTLLTAESSDYIKQLYATGFLKDTPYQFIRKDGEQLDVLLTAHLIVDSEKQVQGARIALLDTTEHNRVQSEKDKLERQLVQVRKLESIGRLAGGIAHDLNNLLSPILGYSELLKGDNTLSQKQISQLEQITKAGCGARDLVKQLLAFSRKQTLEITSVNVNNILSEYKRLLKHTIPANISIEWILSEDISLINADIGQIEQVIMNLVINAADSMADGGHLTVETSTFIFDENFCNTHQEVVPGEYVMIRFSDTGCGMDSKTVENIFEPFFSTKGEMGTGLGLATVYGIVKQHNGTIWVYSEPDIGTTFKVYLPISDQTIEKEPIKRTLHQELLGNENILLVEDNKQVREIAQTILQQYGYNVISAGNGGEALSILEQADQNIDLLLTDVMMPDMNGKKLHSQMCEKIPQLKVVYMSGYTGDIIDGKNIFIQKPFTTQLLAEKVREALGIHIPMKQAP